METSDGKRHEPRAARPRASCRSLAGSACRAGRQAGEADRVPWGFVVVTDERNIAHCPHSVDGRPQCGLSGRYQSASGNLLLMTQDFDEARRQAVAVGWADSPLDQKSYAAMHGISPRTLREWVRRLGVVDRPAVRALVIIDTAIAQLQALRAALDAGEARRSGEHAAHVADEPNRHAEPEPHAPAPAASAAAEPGLVPMPIPRPGVFW